MSKNLLLLAALVAWTFGPASDAGAGEAAKPVVKVKPPVAAAKDTKPPASAKKGSSIGKGKAAMTADSGSIWVEEINIDGGGEIEETDALWDGKNKVLYLYDELDLGCAWTDGVASSSLLVALYGDGNVAKQPAGSGWWIAVLDESECAAEEIDVSGCRFDAKGNATECGEVDSYAVDEIIFVD